MQKFGKRFNLTSSNRSVNNKDVIMTNTSLTTGLSQIYQPDGEDKGL